MNVKRQGEWLVARLPGPHRVASWAIVGGGIRDARTVAWLCVSNADLAPGVDPARLLEERLRDGDLVDAVGLLTSANLDRYEEAIGRYEDLEAHAVVTVGLSNALRVGDPPHGPSIGTINLLVTVSVPLTDEALIEALSIATEARTVAVLEAGVPSRRTGGVASGTGTDCVVMAAPTGIGQPYAGKHTGVGHVVGDAVFRATARGVASWLERHTRG